MEYIIQEIKLHIVEGGVDKPRWMESNSGEFTVASIFQLVRRRKGVQ